MLNQLLSEEEIRQKMTEISRNYLKERRALKDAFRGLARRKALAQKAAKLAATELLTDPDAIDFLQRNQSGKWTEADKEAVVILETSKDQEAYDEAKFDCDTSDKYFAQLEKQLTYYQSLMKFTGPTT
jgi:hypothetical protein